MIRKLLVGFFVLSFVFQLNSIDTRLLDRRYNEVAFLMTHNATSLRPETSPIKEILFKIVNAVPSWLGREQLMNAIKTVTLLDPNLAADQARDIERQLSDGIRAFKLPVQLGDTDIATSELYACHSLSVGQVQGLINEVDAVFKKFIPIAFIRKALLKPLYVIKDNPCLLDSTHVLLAAVFLKINTWLERHPDEIISIYFDVAVVDKIAAKNTLKNILEKSGLWQKVYQYTPGSAWPTLRTLISSGKRLVLISDCSQWSTLGIANKYDIGFGSSYEYKTLDALYADTAEPKIAWGTAGKNRIFILDNYTTPLASRRLIDAEKANSATHIMMRVKNYEKVTGYPVTFVMVDFYDVPQEQALRGIETINNQRA